MAYLVLARHGESEWNKLGFWTGWTDIGLTQEGREQARNAAPLIKDIPLNLIYVSRLKRSKQTWEEFAKVLHLESLPVIEDIALNERDYGNFDGMNKFQIEKEYGEEIFQKWHRSWDYPLPHGETLKDVYNRVIPYYTDTILPELKQGKNVGIFAHGNSLRALIKFLDTVSEEDIVKIELPFSEPYVYQIDQEGKIISKEIRSVQLP